jgi:hypothetical protein
MNVQEFLKKVIDQTEDTELFFAAKFLDQNGRCNFVTATITHRFDVNTFAGNPQTVLRDMANWCINYWAEIEDATIHNPNDLTDAEVVELYFKAHDTEQFTYSINEGFSSELPERRKWIPLS